MVANSEREDLAFEETRVSGTIGCLEELPDPMATGDSRLKRMQVIRRLRFGLVKRMQVIPCLRFGLVDMDQLQKLMLQMECAPSSDSQEKRCNLERYERFGQLRG